MIRLNGNPVKFDTYPNGETKVTFPENYEKISINTIRFHYESDADILYLKFVKDHLDQITLSYWDLFIDYMPYERMDRSENGSVFTLRSVANLINSLNFRKVKVVEPHSDVTCALLDRSEPFWFSKLLDLKGWLGHDAGFDIKYDYVVFPDSGAEKRYASFFPDFNTLTANKHRDFETGRITKLTINVDEPIPFRIGRQAFIIDDLSSYGGTFVMAALKLRDLGFSKISLWVAHAEDSIFKGKLLDHINYIYCSDSMTHSKEHSRVHVIPLEGK